MAEETPASILTGLGDAQNFLSCLSWGRAGDRVCSRALLHGVRGVLRVHPALALTRVDFGGVGEVGGTC